jgi:hypothetical protein
MEAQANEQTRVSRKEEWGAAEENSVPQHGLSGKTHVYLANCCGSSKMGRLMYTAPTGGRILPLLCGSGAENMFLDCCDSKTYRWEPEEIIKQRCDSL